MNCVEFEKRLQDDFDRRACEPSAELLAHAHECAVCRAALEQARFLFEAIPAWRSQIPDADLCESVIEAHARGETGEALSVVREASCTPVDMSPASHAADSARTAHPGRTWRGQVVAGVAAAAALVAVALTWPLFRHAPPAHPVADSTAAPKSSPAVAREIEGDELALLDDAGKTYRHLASRAAGAIDDVAQFVSPGGNAPSAVENNSDSRPVWIEELRPIGKSLADAFDFLWQAGAGEDGSRT